MSYFSLSLSKVNVLHKNKEVAAVWQAHSLNLGCLRLEGLFTKCVFLLKIDVAVFLCGSILHFLLWNATFLMSLCINRQW